MNEIERTAQTASAGHAAASGQVNKPQLPWVPEGRPDWHEGWITGYVRGIQLIANELSGPDAPPVDYDTVLVVLGPAFSTQAHAESVKRYDNYHKVGGWPHEPLAFDRLDVLCRVIGRKARVLTPSAGAKEEALKVVGAEPQLTPRRER
jgi:hypothetical protein